MFCACVEWISFLQETKSHPPIWNLINKSTRGVTPCLHPSPRQLLSPRHPEYPQSPLWNDIALTTALFSISQHTRVLKPSISPHLTPLFAITAQVSAEVLQTQSTIQSLELGTSLEAVLISFLWFSYKLQLNIYKRNASSFYDPHSNMPFYIWSRITEFPMPVIAVFWNSALMFDSINQTSNPEIRGRKEWFRIV